MRVFLLLLALSTSSADLQGDELCHQKCSCRHGVVRCFELVHMPHTLPTNTTEIYFDTLVAETIPPGAFRSVGLTLRKIEFNRCNIGKVEGCAFDGLVQLESLNIIWTVIGTMATMAIRNITMPTSIVLEKSTITTLETSAFHQLTNLTIFQMSNCTIHEMEPAVFTGLSNVTNGFSIRKTRFIAFQYVIFHQMQSVGKIDFSENTIEDIPCFGLDSLVSDTNEVSILENHINCGCNNIGTGENLSEDRYVKGQLLQSKCFGRVNTEGITLSETLDKGSCENKKCTASDPKDLTRFKCAKERVRHINPGNRDHGHPHGAARRDLLQLPMLQFAILITVAHIVFL